MPAFSWNQSNRNFDQQENIRQAHNTVNLLTGLQAT